MWVADWELVCILQLAYMTLWHLTIAYTFRNPALSVTKCRYLQSLLQYAKANALRLNELSHTELLQMAALTSAQLARLRRTPCTAPAAAAIYAGLEI